MIILIAIACGLLSWYAYIGIQISQLKINPYRPKPTMLPFIGAMVVLTLSVYLIEFLYGNGELI